MALALAVWLLSISFGSYYRAAYPVRYADAVQLAAQQTGLPQSLIYAVIRSESGFRPGVESSVGARGLMQITPDTLSWVRYRLGEQGASDPELLWQPETNIHYGSNTLALLQHEFGTVETALAAYHAGFGNVTKWLADPRYSPDGVTLTDIPFGDTASYVTKVLQTATMYQNVYHEFS